MKNVVNKVNDRRSAFYKDQPEVEAVFVKRTAFFVLKFVSR